MELAVLVGGWLLLLVLVLIALAVLQMVRILEKL